MKKTLFAIALCMMLAPMTSCGGGGNTPKEQEFTNVYFDNTDVVYDGKEHILSEVRGDIPEGTNITYEGRVPHIDIGTYEASATLTKEGYKTKTLEATLTIAAQEFTNVHFNDVTVDYDGQPHILGEVTGDIPTGTNITYSGRESHTDVGKYNATATLSKEGYATKTLTATLTINGQEFTGVKFESVEVEYDGESHILGEVTGNIPTGTNIAYTGRENHTDAGKYDASATLTKTGYNTKTLTAALTITKAEFEDLSYDSKIVIYDGSDHIKDVGLVGNVPQSATIKETIKNSSGQTVKEAVEVGVYSYHIEVEDKNYVTYTNDATLTIKLNKTDMAVFAASDGTIYFANGKDNRYLYSLNNATFKRLDYSTPKEFNKYSPSKALYIAGTPLLNAVKEVSSNETKVVYTDGNIDDFVKYSDSIYYYSSNSLTADKSGIYKVDATNSEDEPIVTKIFTGKSDSLAIYGENLYFINKSDHDYIYKINLSTVTSSSVLNEKVHEFTISNGKLYCTVDGTLNDYIGYIDLSSATPEVKTLTLAAGEFLTIKNNKLYYNYTDLFGIIDPDNYGVWSIDLSSKDKVHHVKTLNVNGFDVEPSGSIVYTNTQDLHLYRYNPSSKVTTDLLKDFVAPEVTPINTGGRTVAHNNKIYYLNMYAGKTLCVYDEDAKESHQLSTGKVEDFFIYNNKIYFNQVTRLTNNDIYVADLNAGTGAVKISTNDVRGMISDGTYIYGVHHNFVGTAGGLSRMKLDGSEYVKFSEVNDAKNLAIRDNKLYYINCAEFPIVQDNGDIEYISLSEITPTSEDLKGTNLSSKIKNVKQFIFDNDNIFYIYNGYSNNSVRRTDFTTLESGTEIASKETNPNEIILCGDYVYYYSYASSAKDKAGFYKVSKTAAGDETYELVHGYEEKYFGSDFAISGSNLYFLNYIPKLLFGDAHTYQLNLDTKVITKIA